MMIKGPADFEKAMHGIYTRAKLEATYNAKLYLQMLYERGGLGTAKYLINAATVSDGYTALHLRNRLDLTVEAVVVEHSQWHALFTSQELDRARHRLRQYGYEARE